MIRIAIAQINPTVGDLQKNTDRILDAAHAAAAKKASLVLFPELAVTGYPPEDLVFKKHFVTANLESLARIRRLAPKLTLVTGFIDRGPKGEVYNAAAVIQNRVLTAVYRKICLPNYGVFDEIRYFAKGSRPLVLQSPDGNVAVSICEDLWPRPSPYVELLMGTPVHLLLNPSASPYHFDKQKEREALMKSRALELNTHVAYANLVGGQDELVFDGSSLIYDPRGNRVARAARFREDLLFADIPPAPRAERKKPAGKPRVEFKKAGPFAAAQAGRLPPLLRRRTGPDTDPSAEIYEALVLGTRDYVRRNLFSKVIVGASGGIDSALVAVVAADAIGSENVILVTMPSEFNSRETRRDAELLAKNLGTEFLEIPIDGLRLAFEKALKSAFRKLKAGAAEENVQARIRGNLLMALSNKFGYLVLTTGNKSELATGYCTLYGDMAGGFAVLKDVPKTTVYKLSRYRNSFGGRPPIPQSTILRAPSAELRPNQKDTDSLPDYPTLDAILEAYVENDASLQNIARKGFKEKVVRSVIRRVDLNEYKRRQGAPGIKITPKAFGRDRRMPITNVFSR